MSDEEPVIPPTDAPTQPEPGPGYWPDEWQRHIDRAEQNLVDNPPPVFGQPEPEPEPPVLTPLAFDPADHTVAEVEDYVAEHPDQRQAVLDAETNGKDRVTLVDWLQADAG